MAGLRRIVALGAVAVAAVTFAARADVPVSSTFDNDDEGWRIVRREQTFIPQYRPTGGNPGGHVAGDDNDIGQRWFWNAPDKFLGDISPAYGTPLTYDLFQIGGESPLETAEDVILFGTDLTLVFDFNFEPARDWTPFQVNLDENAGWVLRESFDRPTRDEFMSVLSDLQGLQIRGDYFGGPNIGGLDNVTVVPEPASVLLLLPAGLYLVRRRRRSNQTG